MKPIAYIAGKITGDPTYREKFAHAQEVLEHRGLHRSQPSSFARRHEFQGLYADLYADARYGRCGFLSTGMAEQQGRTARKAVLRLRSETELHI